MLDLAAEHPSLDRRYHLVAPPGSGKTIIGLELVGRFGRPAVVFAPTTTIQVQWLDKLAMFTPDPVTHGSRDARALGAVTALTYQVISTPDAATDALRDLATGSRYGVSTNVTPVAESRTKCVMLPLRSTK
jgi:superfamily II DNA or RNA helicase